MARKITDLNSLGTVAGDDVIIIHDTDAVQDKQAALSDVKTYMNDHNHDSDYLALSGGTITSNLVVQGDLTVSGTTTTVNTETMELADNLILINSNETGTPSQDGGIEVERGTSTNYQFLFQEASDTFKIGEVGSLQAVATREDAPENFGIPHWDSGSNSFITTSDFEMNSGNMTVPGNVEISGSGWAIFPNRLGAGRVPNHADGATLQVDGGILVQDGIKLVNASNEITSVWYVSGPEDISIMRNYNNVATLLSLRAQATAPTAGPDREATLALVRTDDSGNEEFMDVFNNGYHSNGNVEHGIRIQKRGTGLYRDFAIQYSDGTTVDDVMRVDATTQEVEFSNDVTINSRRVVTVSSGTSFPGSPGLGDEVYRTDLDEWYKYNGSVWTQI